jgi:hypothetical protein
VESVPASGRGGEGGQNRLPAVQTVTEVVQLIGEHRPLFLRYQAANPEVRAKLPGSHRYTSPESEYRSVNAAA